MRRLPGSCSAADYRLARKLAELIGKQHPGLLTVLAWRDPKGYRRAMGTGTDVIAPVRFGTVDRHEVDDILVHRRRMGTVAIRPGRAKVDLQDAGTGGPVLHLEPMELTKGKGDEIERRVFGHRKENREPLSCQIGMHLRDAEVALVLREVHPHAFERRESWVRRSAAIRLKCVRCLRSSVDRATAF